MAGDDLEGEIAKIICETQASYGQAFITSEWAAAAAEGIAERLRRPRACDSCGKDSEFLECSRCSNEAHLYDNEF